MLWPFPHVCCIVISERVTGMKTLKKYQTAQFTWFLDDERVHGLLQTIVHQDGQRRSYIVSDYGGMKLFVKTFEEKGTVGRLRSIIAPRGKKEFFIARKLHELDVPAPLPLGFGLGAQQSAIIEIFIDGKTLLGLFKDVTDSQTILKKLSGFLLLLKDKKVRHDDLHLDNILVSGNTFYLIDLHKVRIRNIFSETDEIANLKHALGSIYYDINPAEVRIFFESYGASTSLKYKVINAVLDLRDTWVRNKMARAFQDTSIVRKDGPRLVMRGKEECGTGKFVEIIKNDRKVKVGRYADHIRKTYKGTSRMKTAWKNHVVLEYMKKNMTPAAFFAEIGRSGGFIAMEDLTGRGEELDRYLDRNWDAMDTRERRALINDLASFFTGAFSWSILHRDLKACNIFALTRGTFLFLDVEDIRFSRVKPDTLKRAFLQLNNTIPKRISIRDRMRFFLRLIAGLDISLDRKQFFNDVANQSVKGEIVYVGVSGLVIDTWNDRT